MIFAESDITITNQVENEGFKNIAPVGWHVPTFDDFKDLLFSLDENTTEGYDPKYLSLIAGGKIKETGTIHWRPPNTGATNESGFTALPAPTRDSDGTFLAYNQMYMKLWSSTRIDYPQWPYAFFCTYEDASASLSNGGSDPIAGETIRCVADSTTKSIGETGTVTDIDGNVYPTKVMPDGKEWMCANLRVTKFNDGTPIPNVTSNAQWVALETAGMCWYNNTPV